MTSAFNYLQQLLSAWSVELAAVVLVAACWFISSVLLSLEIGP